MRPAEPAQRRLDEGDSTRWLKGTETMTTTLHDTKCRAGQLGGITTFLRSGDSDESRHQVMQQRGRLGGRPRTVFTYEEIIQRLQEQPAIKNKNRKEKKQPNNESAVNVNTLQFDYAGRLTGRNALV